MLREPIVWSGRDEAGDSFRGKDPRDIAHRIQREAHALRFQRHGIFREYGVKGMHWGVHKPHDISSWESVGGQLGSNPGGLYKDLNGEKYYVKFYENMEQGKSEILANSIYRSLGIPAPDSQLVEKGGKLGVASTWQEGAKSTTKNEQADSFLFKQGFVADAFLANHDVVGLTFDNVIKTSGGSMMRIDNGGSMFFRAQGAAKTGFTKDAVPELQSMRNPDVAKRAGQVFQDLEQGNIKVQADKLVKVLDDSKLHELIAGAGIEGSQADKYFNMLQGRRDAIQKEVLDEKPKQPETPKATQPDTKAGLSTKSDEDDEDEGKSKVSRKEYYQNRPINPNKAGGYFNKSSGRGKIFTALENAKGDWVKLDDLAKGHTAKVGSRLGRLKLIGQWTGRWAIEVSGDQARMFMKTGAPKEQKSFEQLEKESDVATATAKKFIELQGKHGEIANISIGESKTLFDNYYKSNGVPVTSQNHYRLAVDGWTGSVSSDGGLALRKLAAEQYGRSLDDEHNGSHQFKNNDPYSALKDAALAMKKYAGAYAKEAGINVVYRGVFGEAGKKIREALQSSGEVKVPVNALSSWSTSKSVARKFATKYSGGVVLKLKVDPDNIWASQKSTPWLFSGFTHEQEVIVGHSQKHEKFKKEDVEIV